MTATLAAAPPQTATYKPCLRCAKPIRPHRAHLADHPGTVSYGGRGMCSWCRRLAGPLPERNPADLIEDADWLTMPGNFVATPEQVAARLGYASVHTLMDMLRRYGATDVLRRIQAKAAAS